MKKKVQLTKLAPNCGCAAKVGPGTLAGVLGNLPKFCDPDLLVGTDTSDDAAAVSYTHLTLPTILRV